jgi:hypothetical protein
MATHEGDTVEYGPADEPSFYGRLPHVALLVVTAAALGVAFGLLVRGELLLGVILLLGSVVALLWFVQEAARRRSSRLDGIVAGGRDRVRALSGYAGSSVRLWSSASGRVARLRLEMRRLARARSGAQFELGGATYAGDQLAAAAITERMRALDGQLADCAERMRREVERAQSRLAEERLAVQRTQVRRAAR